MLLFKMNESGIDQSWKTWIKRLKLVYVLYGSLLTLKIVNLGWTGQRCEKDISFCDSQQCLNNANCINLLGETAKGLNVMKRLQIAELAILAWIKVIVVISDQASTVLAIATTSASVVNTNLMLVLLVFARMALHASAPQYLMQYFPTWIGLGIKRFNFDLSEAFWNFKTEIKLKIVRLRF